MQVIQRSEADNGELKYWDLTKDSIKEREEFVNKYIKPYYKGFKMLKGGNQNALWEHNGASVTAANGITNNGTIISISTLNGVLYILFDVNGYKKPNKMGRDIFYFNTITGKLMPAGWQNGLTREMALSGYYAEDGLKYSCKKIKNK